MSKTTTKTTTVTENFDSDGVLTQRVTETTEEVFEDPTPPNYIPNPSYPAPYITWGGGGIVTTECQCLVPGKTCYKHATLINTQNTNPTNMSIRVADGCFAVPDIEAQPQGAVSEGSIYEREEDCGFEGCGCSY